MSSRLTYGHFFQTGTQDCGNAFSPSDFDLEPDKTPEQIVDAELDTWDRDAWLEQQDDFEGLDPNSAYEHWKDGWRSCAIESVKSALERKKRQQLEDLTLYYLATLSSDPSESGHADTVDIIESFDSLDVAVDELARIRGPASVLEGDGDGPHATVVFKRRDGTFGGPGWHRYFTAFRRGELRKAHIAARERNFRRNPAEPDRDAAVAKYEEFHRFKPTLIGEFPRGFVIPTHLDHAGAAKWVTYRSNKIDPATLKRPRKPIDYIHEHDAGVKLYLPTAPSSHARIRVPESITSVAALTRLGACLGFCYETTDGKRQEAEAVSPYPDLYATPDGKCLLVIQSRTKVLAMMWGGALGVFARGIDG